MVKVFRSKRSILGILSILGLTIIISCGGVAKNPASAPFDNRTTQPGAPGQSPSQDGLKAEEQAGAPVIREGASYEELMTTARTSMEGGFIKTAAEAYGKAFDANQDRPDAALAYVITRLAGSPKELSVLIEPGVDYFFYNTPLIGRWDILPIPLAREDSYLLRIFALGSLYNQKNIVPRVPGGATPPRTTKPKEKPGETSSSPVTEMITPDGSTQVPGGDVIQGGGDRTTQMSDDKRNLYQSLGSSSGDTSGGTKLVFDGTGGSVDIQYLNYEKDILPNLIKDSKEIARSFTAGYLNLNTSQMYSNDLKTLVDELVDKLEKGKRTVENQDFNLEMSFILDKTENSAYKLYFKNYDYMIILGYLRYIQGVLAYQSAYKSGQTSELIFKIPEDKDDDGILSPDEYYPGNGFGELVKDGKEILADSLDGIKSGAALLVTNLDKLYNDDKLLDFRGNLVIPSNVDQFLVDKISEERDEYSDLQVFTTAGKANRSVNTTEGRVRVEVALSGIFSEAAPTKVKELLPDLDPKTFEPVLDAEDSVFSDPTWGGIFPNGFDDFNAFRFRNDIKGTLTYQGTGVKDVTIATDSGKSGKTNEKGEFTIKDVELNKLVGISVTISTDLLEKSHRAQLRNAWVAVDIELFKSAMNGAPVTDEMMTTTDEGSTVFSVDEEGAAYSGGGGGSRIKDVIDGVKNENESSDSGDEEHTEVDEVLG